MNIREQILDFFKQIRKYKNVYEQVKIFPYLTSLRLKFQFAQSRIRSLKRKKKLYMKKRIEVRNERGIRVTWSDAYSLEMDFDHCIVSLRSIIEHLMQLINVVIPLGLLSRRKKYQSSVDIQTIITSLIEQNSMKDNIELKNLIALLQSMTNEAWYISLNELRVEGYHNRFVTPNISQHRTRDTRELTDIDLLIPFESDGRTHVDIIVYCEDRLNEVATIASKTLEALLNYVSRDTDGIPTKNK